MRIVEFVNTVSRMRSAQKAYFKTGLQSDLIVFKMLEAMVDKALDDGILLWSAATPAELDTISVQRPTEGKNAQK